MRTPVSRRRGSTRGAKQVEGGAQPAGDAIRKSESAGKKIAARKWECPTCRARKVFRRRGAP